MQLAKEVTEEEIRKIIFDMPSDKSPGPDGYTSEFFKAAWNVVGKDVTVAIQSFFEKGFLPKGLNSTILALIPKKEKAEEMKDYRPISCCNVLYKAISKILASRLKRILPKNIALNQSAFVSDRLLMENLMLATELVKDYHKKDISARCCMKIDISKAFDSVQWPFLLNTLQALGFPGKFIHWINLCISTASFSVQVNGELAGYFQSTRGLRQGCSLSPYLFVLSMNVLSMLMDEAAEKRKIGYHPRCQNIKLTHLCFADDLMIFADGSKRSLDGILEVFEVFEKASGLKINLEKSTLYMAGNTSQNQADIQGVPFAKGSLPVRYLGLPLLTKRMTVSDFLLLVEKIRSRISSWMGRFLSFGGRLQLIQSVITSLANFWLSAFRLPAACLKEIEHLCSAFLWSGPALNTNKAKVAWSEVCKPKEEGGLGIRPLKEVNTVSCLKLIWRLLTAKNSLWVSWIQVHLIRKGSFWTVKENTQLGSWMWGKILKYRSIAKGFYRVSVKNGKQTSFWHEAWSDLGCLMDITGPSGYIDMGISKNATVQEAMIIHRRRRHRVTILNQIEDELGKCKELSSLDEDIGLWKRRDEVFKRKFASKSTWNQIRSSGTRQEWSQGIWFHNATPKYSFLAWLAILNRLSTGDRMLRWGGSFNVKCSFCDEEVETRNHLFFECRYLMEVWEKLAKGLMGEGFTNVWSEIITLISTGQNSLEIFTLKYAFQTTIHGLWLERNSRRHGEAPVPVETLIKMVDRRIRNRFLSVQRAGDKSLEEGLQYWFSTRLVF